MSELETFYSTFIAAVGRRDVAAISALIDPEFTIHYDSGLPFGGTYSGAEGFFTVLGRLSASLTDLKTEQLNYMEDANGEQYGLVIKLTATTELTGRTVGTTVSELWTVRAGKAVEARVWFWGVAALLDD